MVEQKQRGRPMLDPEERRVQFSVRVAPDLMPLLERLEQETGLSRSMLVEQAIRDFAARKVKSSTENLFTAPI
jgi:hypothetical protein